MTCGMANDPWFGVPEHDETAAAFPAIGILRDVSARDQAAHGMRDEIDRGLRTEPRVDLLAQIVGDAGEILAPVEPERLHVPAIIR